MFQELQIDPIEGTEIMQKLGVNPLHLQDPNVFQRTKNVVKFFQGKKDKDYLLSKLTAGKPNLNKLEHVNNYVELRKDYEAKMGSLRKLADDYEKYKENESKRVETANMATITIKDLEYLKSEIALYEA